MHSLIQVGTRAALLARLTRLTPSTRPSWGRMTGDQMLAHVNDGFSLAYGELETRRRRTWLRVPPLNYLVACLLPFPRNAPTPRELLARAPDEWEVEMARLRDNINAFAGRTRGQRWPDHPHSSGVCRGGRGGCSGIGIWTII